MERKVVTRRTFLMGAAAAGAAVTVRPKRVSANDKLNIAIVGAGGRGGGNINELKDENIVALCDVDWTRAAGSFLKFPNATKYKDYRVMLDKEKDIDAVVVSTPDHMHAFVSIAAMQLGKHVYCEKPLTHSVWEARRVAEVAREAKVATQMGNCGQASDWVRDLCEWVWDGAIGPVREVHVWTDRPLGWWPQGIDRPTEVHDVPKSLDWDLWLGPAPDRPFNRAYLPFVWRGWWDFGTGALGDIGCHALHPVFNVVKLGHPTSVEAASTKVFDETYPLASIVRYEFPAREDMPPLKLVWYDGGLKPQTPPEYNGVLGKNGTYYVGDKGIMLGNTLLPKARANEYKPPEKTLPRSPGHHAEWVRACKGGEPAGANFDIASLVAQVVLLGNVALRAGRKLEWDGAAMRITNMDEANKLLKREYREGWTL